MLDCRLSQIDSKCSDLYPNSGYAVFTAGIDPIEIDTSMLLRTETGKVDREFGLSLIVRRVKPTEPIPLPEVIDGTLVNFSFNESIYRCTQPIFDNGITSDIEGYLITFNQREDITSRRDAYAIKKEIEVHGIEAWELLIK